MRMEKHSTSKPSRPAGVQTNTSPRSPRAVNLSRLSQQIDVDLLAAALLTRETTLRAFIQGREPVRNEYAQQIGIHLAEAGFAAHWLDMDNAPITKAHIEALREMAALSVEKSPVRRDNLRELAKAFQGSLQLLADALEITEDSLSNIIEGTVKFDEQRMGHVNPRLMAAGFPNSWLELPNAKVDPEWVEALKTMATDAYETAFELEQEKERAAEKTRAAAKEAARIAALAVPPAPAQPIETPKEKPIVATVKTTAAKASKQPVPAPAAKAAAPVAPRLPAGIPRGALGAGRPAGAMTPPKPAAAAPRAKPVAAEGTPKAQSLLRAAALEKLLDMARRGSKACLWRDLLGRSLPYWGNVRNGAIMLKDELADEITAALGLPKGWLDNPVFPPATVAAWVMDPTVPLPAGKEAVAAATAPAVAVATPTPTPAKAAAKPAAPQPAVAKAPAAVAPAAPPMPMSAVKARAVAGLGRAMGGKVAAAPAPKPAPAPAPKPEAAAPVAPAAPAVISAPVAPAVPVVAAPAPAEAGFVWQAPASPEPQAVPGHLVQALVGQINKMAEAGTFTEQDALRLLYYMMIPR